MKRYSVAKILLQTHFLIHLLIPSRGKEGRIPRKVNISELEGKN